MDHLELIGKYLTNESSVEENEHLLAWIRSNPEHKQEFLDTCSIWHASRINSKKFDHIKAFDKFKENKIISQKSKESSTIHSAPKISLWKRLSLPIAAAIMLSAGLMYIFKPSDKTIIYSNNTSVSKSFTLPDGTVVFLNKNASITLPEKFEGQTRQVSMNGEIFFNVKKNPAKPFIIEAGSGKITVKGTSFNVDYNTNTSTCEVIVSTGIVEFSSKTNKSITLTHDEKGNLNLKNNELSESINDDINYLSWKTGILVFKNSPYQQVFKDIERHFGITIKYPDGMNSKLALTATFDHESLQSTLNVVEMMFDIKINKQNSIFVVRK